MLVSPCVECLCVASLRTVCYALSDAYIGGGGGGTHNILKGVLHTKKLATKTKTTLTTPTKTTTTTTTRQFHRDGSTNQTTNSTISRPSKD